MLDRRVRQRRSGANDERAAELHAAITAPRPPLTLGERTLRFDQPQVAGILNVTPDSFSDGGKHDRPGRRCRRRDGRGRARR